MSLTTQHAPNCASLRLLLSDPPQTQECDCGATRDQVSSLIKGGRPNVLTFPGSKPAEIAGGAPPALSPQAIEIIAELRALADDVAAGRVKTDLVLVIASNNGSVTAPDSFGRPAYYSEVVGLLHAAAHCTLTSVINFNDPD